MAIRIIALLALLTGAQAIRAQVRAGSENDGLSAVMEGLSDSNPKVRADSIRKLGAIASKGGERTAIPALVRALRDPDFLVRWSAISALGLFGESARDAVPALVQAMQDPRLRRAAPMTLEKIGQAARGAVPALLRSLRDPDAVVAVNSARAIIAIESPSSPALRAVENALVHMIRTQKGEERASAVSSLGRIESLSREGLSALFEALADRDAAVSRVAVFAVEAIGPAAAPVVPILVDIMKNPKLGNWSLPVGRAIWGRPAGSSAMGGSIVRLPMEEKPGTRVRVERTAPAGPDPGAAIYGSAGQSQGSAARIYRSNIVDALSSIGPFAKDALPALSEALRDTKSYDSTQVAKAMSKMGPAGCRELVRATLDVRNSRASSAAYETLRKLGPIAYPAMIQALDRLSPKDQTRILSVLRADEELPSSMFPIFVRLFRDPDPSVSASAAWRLARYGPAAVPILADALDRADRTRRSSLLRNLVSSGPDAVPLLIERLRTGNVEFRAAVAVALGDMGPAASSAVPELIRAGRDPDPGLRKEAVRTLGLIGPKAKDAAPMLVEALQDESAVVHNEALRALEKIGPAAGDAVPALIKLAAKGQSPFSITQLNPDLNRAARELRRRELEFEDSLLAVDALGEIGPAAKDAIPVLERLLRSRTTLVPVAAAAALTKIAPGGSPSFNKAVDLLIEAAGLRVYSQEEAAAVKRAVKALVRIHLPEGRAVRIWAPFLRRKDFPAEAAEAFGRIGAPAVPTLLEALSDPAARKNAVVAIGEVGPAAKQAIPVLARMMNGAASEPNEYELCREIVKALGKLGPAAVPVLVATQKGGKYNLFHEALGALNQMGPAAVPEFIRLLRDPDPLYRAEAAEFLGSIRPASGETVAALASAIDDPDLPVQDKAVTSLGKLGTESKSAVPALNRALWDPRRSNVDSVLQSLSKIGPDAAEVLAQSLKCRKRGVWIKASDALVEMGPAAVRPTTRILGDPNERIKRLAEAVLLRMGPAAAPELRKAAAEIPTLRSSIGRILEEIRQVEMTPAVPN